MSRFDSSSHQAMAAMALVAHRTLVDVGVTSSTLYVCDGYHCLFALGNTYTPVGHFGGIDAIQEESDPFPRWIKLWLSAVGSANIFEPVSEGLFNKPVKVYDAFISPDTFSAVHTPQTIFAGTINEVEIKFKDPERGNYFELTVETELRREPVMAYSNKETLWLTYSGDTFCNFQHLIPTFRSKWGNEATSFVDGVGRPRSGGGGRGGGGPGGGGGGPRRGRW